MTDFLFHGVAPPLLWLTVTLLIFAAADAVSRRCNRHPMLHPVLLAAPVLILILWRTDTSYAAYADATWMLTFLLGPTTVALAVPLHGNIRLMRPVLKPLLAALLAGAATATISAVGIAMLFDVPAEILAALAPRSATTPVAMALAAQLGGVPSLAALIAVLSGLIGAMFGRPLLNAIGIHDVRARGFAVGVAAHGIGTARAFQTSAVAGSFAGVGMATSAAVTSILLTLAALFLSN